uniref:5-hydroxytryptamine (serotonin) receptor 2A, genome duplicate b n=1 Tax=Eptatretus burgeri TaxID=7764 RepID=A0A8C4QS47_EPTBU
MAFWGNSNASTGLGEFPAPSSSPPGLSSVDGLHWTAMLALAAVVPTVTGNLLVIIAVWRERRLQTATNYFLSSLAVADLLVGLLVMPVSLVNVLYGYRWPLPPQLCPAWIYLDVLFSTASIMHLCAISLDRYVAIKRPIQHSRYNSRAKALFKILAVWLISIGISMPVPIISSHDISKVYEAHQCLLNFSEFVIYGSLSAFFLPLIIMVVSYVLTVHTLRRQAAIYGSDERSASRPPASSGQGSSPWASTRMSVCRESSAGHRPSTASQRRTAQAINNERRASKVLGIVFALFVAMWCPFFVTNVLTALCPAHLCHPATLEQLLQVFVWVGYVSSGVNPLVYTLFNRTYRQAFARYISCDCRSQPAQPLPFQLYSRNVSRSFSVYVAPFEEVQPSHSTSRYRNGRWRSNGPSHRVREHCDKGLATAATPGAQPDQSPSSGPLEAGSLR